MEFEYSTKLQLTPHTTKKIAQSQTKLQLAIRVLIDMLYNQNICEKLEFPLKSMFFSTPPGQEYGFIYFKVTGAFEDIVDFIESEGWDAPNTLKKIKSIKPYTHV